MIIWVIFLILLLMSLTKNKLIVWRIFFKKGKFKKERAWYIFITSQNNIFGSVGLLYELETIGHRQIKRKAK